MVARDQEGIRIMGLWVMNAVVVDLVIRGHFMFLVAGVV